MLLSQEPAPDTTILVGGHESAQGADLTPLLDLLHTTTRHTLVTPPGRALHDAVVTRLAAGEGAVLVLPMTWGRDPRMVADTARTLHWLAAGARPGRLALCAPFGTPDHLVAWLRQAAVRVAGSRHRAGVLLTAPAADPFDDADLHRIAHLVRSNGSGVPIEVACLAGPADLDKGVRRARLLGSDEVVVVPAGFARSAPGELPEQASFSGPLLSERALLDVIDRRVAAARHELDHGGDGIAAGLVADHHHGYAHSHAFEGAAGEHTPAHTHPHPHAHRKDAPCWEAPSTTTVMTTSRSTRVARPSPSP